MMKLKSDWVLHTEFVHTQKKDIKAEANCPCGIKERHKHCGICGNVTCIGDWDAPPIATFTLDFKAGTFKKTS